jgi:serine protease inhibitor
METRCQIDRLLNFKKCNEDVGRANAYLKKCIKKPSIKESGKLVTLNQIYVHNVENSQKFNQIYLDLVDKYYKSGIEFMNFDNKNESLYKINHWIGQKTKDKLKYLAEECDLHPKGMILINATYFCGKWKNPFDVRNTKTNVEFRLSDGNIERVDMMCQYNVDYNYNENYKSLNASICELPYEGNLSLIIILPHDDINIALVESNLDINILENLNEIFTKKRINVSIPIFKLHIKTEVTDFFNFRTLNNLFSFIQLSGELIKMGAENLFLKNISNFSTIFEDEKTNEYSHLTKVIHKAILRVNETGTIGPENKQSEKRLFNKTSEYDENNLNNNLTTLNFICNRPFIFLIRDYETNLILFIGKYERRQ